MLLIAINRAGPVCAIVIIKHNYILMCEHQFLGGQNYFRHRERSHLLLSCGIVYNVTRWSLCELKRDLLYFL